MHKKIDEIKKGESKPKILKNVFDKSETERARIFPSFTNKPHSKQDVIGGGQGVTLSCS